MARRSQATVTPISGGRRSSFSDGLADEKLAGPTETAVIAAEKVLGAFIWSDARRNFIEHYCATLNAAEAARRAGFAARSAKQIGSALMKREPIRAAINQRLAELSATARLKTESIVAAACAVAFFDPAEMFDADGSIKPMADIPPNARAAIAGIEESFSEKGSVRRIRFANRMDAVVFLGRIKGLMAADKVEVSGPEGDPIAVLIQQLQGTTLALKK